MTRTPKTLKTAIGMVPVIPIKKMVGTIDVYGYKWHFKVEFLIYQGAERGLSGS